ncbi:MAG: hypothetical protein LBC71_00580 [Oscillospiraceae bacterium]|jgi:nitrous oxidase accessory protein NosD|nr:hypothetical protein [Oscillospiraceae bacterium]
MIENSTVYQSFNVNDIRRMRDEAEIHYRNMSYEEITKDIHERAKIGYAIMDSLRHKKATQYST